MKKIYIYNLIILNSTSTLKVFSLSCNTEAKFSFDQKLVLVFFCLCTFFVFLSVIMDKFEKNIYWAKLG